MTNRIIKVRVWSNTFKNWHILEINHDMLDGGLYDADFDWDKKGEWTGLLDKNGKEIYEGDVLRCFNVDKGGYLAKVFWFHSGFSIEWQSKEVANIRGGDAEYMLTNTHIDCEIIGNIYEHPNLLK